MMFEDPYLWSQRMARAAKDAMELRLVDALCEIARAPIADELRAEHMAKVISDHDVRLAAICLALGVQ